MTENVDWLPDLLLFNDYDGDWDKYIKAVYKVFVEDFMIFPPSFNSKAIEIRKKPLIQGKEPTFWHVISEGKEEENRIPDIRRCERIPWPKPLIKKYKDKGLPCWQSDRKGHLRPVIALPDFSYVVVLEPRNKYYLLWTTYYLEFPNQRRRKKKEYEEWLKTETASN